VGIQRSVLNSKTRTALLLGVSQAICLAVGLWVQSQLVAATPSGANPSTAISLISFVWIAGLQGAAVWLLLTRLQGEEQEHRTQSQQQSLIRARELVRTRDAVIFGLAKLAESRDPDTGHHLERIALYSTRIATALRKHPKFRHRVTTSFVRSIGISSALHDIGKVGVADSVLLKPGPLTPEQRAHIEEHAAFGADCIREIQSRIGDPEFLQMAYDIANYHHEHWDGGGYPYGLAGDTIPLSARIVAIADVYDALSVRRVYKAPFPHEACVKMIRDDAGRHFDPDLVQVFLQIEDQFRDIAERFSVAEVLAEPESRSGLKMTAEQEQLLGHVLSIPDVAPQTQPRVG